jgi:hypothetical protein
MRIRGVMCLAIGSFSLMPVIASGQAEKSSKSVTAPPAEKAAGVEKWNGMTYRPPKGWKQEKSAENVRLYNAPDSKPGSEAALMLVNGANFEGDFREAFDRVLKAATKDHEVLRTSEVETAKTSEGYDVLVQAIAYKTKEGAEGHRAIHGSPRRGAHGDGLLRRDHGSAGQQIRADADGVSEEPGFAPNERDSPNKPDRSDKPDKEDKPDGDPLVSRAARGLTPAQIARDEATRRKPNTVSGNLYDNRGKLFHFPGVKAWVHIWGFSAEGKRVFFDAQVDANGHYEKQVPHGLYVVNAYALFPVNGNPVRVAMDALDERPTEETTDSTPGIVTDFGLKLVGSVHGGKPDSFAGYHGGGVYVTDGANWKEAIFGAMDRKYPAGNLRRGDADTAHPPDRRLAGQAARA